MKVLVIHCAYRFRGGEDTVVAEEIALLRAHGVTVELLQFRNDGQALGKLLQLPFNLSAYRETRRKVRSFGPDVVHLHNLHFAATAAVPYALRKSRVPFVCTLHNYRLICPSAILFHNGRLFLDSVSRAFPWRAVRLGLYKNSKLLTFWLALANKLHQWAGTWQLCHRFIVLSPFARNLFLRSRAGLQPEQLTVKPNFCTVPVVQPTVRQDYFLYVGRLSGEKGIAVVLEAFKKTGARIRIAGDGPYLEEVRRTAAACSNIEYVGTVDKEEVFRLLGEATALVFPSVCFEGMPLTIIEAFACGTPVIASRLGAMESMVEDGHNGLHFEAADAAGLVQRVEQWQSLAPHQADAYRRNARAAYEELYTPEKNAQQLLSLYQEVLERAGTALPERLELAEAG